MMKHTSRPTIGFLIANVVGEYCEIQCFSAHRAAHEKNVNLIIFTPFFSSAIVGSKSEYLKTFEFARKEKVDGIIVSADTISNHLDEMEMQALLGLYSGLPVITLSEHYDGTPAVLVDDKNGMRDLIRHFIKDHGRKRIAFIKGTDGTIEAEHRFSAYREALADYSLPYDPRFVSEGDLSFHSGMTAISELLDERKLTPDAIIAANDYMILGAFSELRTRGIDVPGDMGLGGFGDVTAAKDVDVPLSTVRPPLDEQLHRAFQSILNLIGGECVPEVETLPARLMLRGSCGCQPGNEKYDFSPGENHETGLYSENRESLIRHIAAKRSYNIYFLNRFSTTTMTTLNTLDFEIIKTECGRVMSELGVASCYISLYDDGSPLFVLKDRIPPGRSIPFFAYQDGLREFASEALGAYETDRLVPDEEFFEEKRRTVLFSEIFFHDEHFGSIVFEMLSFDTLLFNLFRAQIANCFHNIFTRRQLDQAYSGLKKSNEDLNRTLETLKTTQAELVHSAKMASLGRLTAGIAHGLKNPLNFITNFSHLSIESIERLKAAIAHYRSALAAEGAKEIDNLIEDLLDNSREVFTHGRHADLIIKGMLNQARESPTIESCNINSILKESVNLAYQSTRSQNPNFNMKIVESYSPSVPAVKANTTNIYKVFINFIENAIYAMKRKKELSAVYDARLEIATRFSEGTLVVSIKDNGTGIKSEIIDKIYDPFFTTKPPEEGTGIGLKTCYEVIVEGLGGEIRCDSKENEYTEFTVILKVRHGQEARHGSKNTHRR